MRSPHHTRNVAQKYQQHWPKNTRANHERFNIIIFANLPFHTKFSKLHSRNSCWSRMAWKTRHCCNVNVSKNWKITWIICCCAWWRHIQKSCRIPTHEPHRQRGKDLLQTEKFNCCMTFSIFLLSNLFFFFVLTLTN